MKKLGDVYLKVIGKTLKGATSLIQKHNGQIRVSVIDGKPLMLTRDFCTDRVNVEINKGKITKADIG